jgi:hypothetical protein
MMLCGEDRPQQLEVFLGAKGLEKEITKMGKQGIGV